MMVEMNSTSLKCRKERAVVQVLCKVWRQCGDSTINSSPIEKQTNDVTAARLEKYNSNVRLSETSTMSKTRYIVL